MARFQPVRIFITSQTFNSHCMRCPISFSRNELKSTRRTIPRQNFRIPALNHS
ncbi:hypothetical protein Goari_007898 [Gossypium aridum]|uniref:Uncharacterized protein n=1 Tax=Gossypium aridum TaxID=34290 RepID=A0A7J8XSG4_GOSAI|nr:hypothetical protein [Gossypium aridum]